MTDQNKSKHETLLDLLEVGLIMMHIDARHPNISVPTHLKDDPHLRLNLSYRFRVPDLNITEESIEVTLSFQQVPHFCKIPLDAIWGVSQPPAPGIHLFLDSMPPEIVFQLMTTQLQGDLPAEQEREEGEEVEVDAPIPFLPALAAAARPSTTPRDEPQDPPSKGRPALRLVVDNSEEMDAPEASPPPPTKRPQLRVVPSAPTEEDDLPS